MRKPRQPLNRFAVLVVGLVLGACAESAGPSERPLGAFLAAARTTASDYDPAATPAALTHQADAVVTGTIVGVARGQSYAPAPDSRPEITTSVLEIHVDEFLHGYPGVVFEGSVYMELAHPAYVGDGNLAPDGEGSKREVPFDHEAFAETVPRAYGVFFLDDRTNEPYWPFIVDEGAGRPGGARITTALIQGFIIEGDDGKPVSVLETFS